MKVLRIQYLVTIALLLLGMNNCQVSDNLNPEGSVIEQSLALQPNSELSSLMGGGHNFILREIMEDSLFDNIDVHVLYLAGEWANKTDSLIPDTTYGFNLAEYIKYASHNADTSASKFFEACIQHFNVPLDSLPAEWGTALSDFTDAVDAGSAALHNYVANYKTEDEILENLLISGEAIYDSSFAFWNEQNLPDVAPWVVADLVGALIGGVAEAGGEYYDGGWGNLDIWSILYWALVGGTGFSIGVVLP